MLTIALTGGIGSGKTAVTNIFQQLSQKSEYKQSLKIIDSDLIARHLLAGSLHESPSEALQSVHRLFGSGLFNDDGQIERAKLRERVFSSESTKKQLEALLHPLIYKEIFSQIATFSKEKPSVNIVIIAIPLLFETHSETQFDRVLVIDVPEQLQIQRTMRRDQCSHELIEQIIASQIDRQTRLNGADDIINNSGDQDALRQQVEKLYQFYCLLAKN